MKKIEKFDHLRLEKALTTSDVQEQLNPTSKEYQVLKAIMREVMTEELEKREKQTLLKFEQHLLKVISEQEQLQQQVSLVLFNQEQSQKREQSMLEGQEKSQSMLKKLGESPTFLAITATIFADWANDIVKEVGKSMIGEERFEACGDALKTLLEPLSSPVLELIAPSPIILKIATAVGILLVARFFLNHTGSLWTAIRSGLAKFRSLFASKK